ncbi:MAG: FtsX-like permease family protein, partial [Bacteroidota bacterium]
YLSAEWKKLFPFQPYEGSFQNEILAEGLLVSNNIKQTFLAMAVVSLLLVATGLLALMSLTIQKRQKEIAIRRILGASLRQISLLVNRHYLIILGIALAIGAWGGNLLSDALINGIFNIALPFEHSISLYASLLLITVALTTILIKIYEIAQANPAEVLKND